MFCIIQNGTKLGKQAALFAAALGGYVSGETGGGAVRHLIAQLGLIGLAKQMMEEK